MARGVSITPIEKGEVQGEKERFRKPDRKKALSRRALFVPEFAAKLEVQKNDRGWGGEGGGGRTGGFQ